MKNFSPELLRLRLALLVCLLFAARIVTAQNPSGHVLSLDGTDGSYVESTSVTDDHLNQITLEAWIRADPAVDGTRAIISSESDRGPWILGIAGDYGDRVEFVLPGLSTLYSLTPVPDGEWHHVAGVYDGATQSIYIDGRLDTTVSAGATVLNPNGIVIGGIGDGQGVSHVWAGQIDEIRVWARPRTAEEVIATLSDTLGPEYFSGSESGLLGYWRLDELLDDSVTVTVVRDRSIPAEDGVVKGHATLVPSLVRNGAPSGVQPPEKFWVEFSWSPVAGAAEYQLQVASDSGYSMILVDTTISDTTFLSNLQGGEGVSYYWRVRAHNLWANRFTNFVVAENAGGSLAPPDAAAFGFHGFPTIDGDGDDRWDNPGGRQQVGPARWAIHSFGRFGYDDFLTDATLRGTLWPEIRGRDYEIRFTDGPNYCVIPEGFVSTNGRAEQNFLIEVPFELWEIGSGEASDLRHFCWVLDRDGDFAIPRLQLGGPGFNLLNEDHPSSSVENDPFTDALYFLRPVNQTPGSDGYDDIVAQFKVDEIGTSHSYGIESQVLRRIVLINWNGGDVTVGPPYSQDMPEVGTTFRITTSRAAPFGDWTDVSVSFGSPFEAPVAVKIQTPENGATGLSAFPTLSWQAQGNIQAYHLQIDSDSSFTAPVVDSDSIGFATITLADPLAYSTTYFWRVRAGRDDGLGKNARMIFGPWSETRSFTVATGVSIEGETSLPTEYALHPAYPNPFNPSTTIRYDVPEAATTRLVVFDALGRVVETLFTGNRTPGRYTVTWEANGVPSGVYFVRMEAGTFSSTMRMVLAK